MRRAVEVAALRETGIAMCEHVRSISRDRLIERRGTVTAGTLAMVEDRPGVLLRLQRRLEEPDPSSQLRFSGENPCAAHTAMHENAVRAGLNA